MFSLANIVPVVVYRSPIQNTIIVYRPTIINGVKNSLGNTIDVEFEFGHGLSYTTFAYSNLTLSPSPALRWNEQLSVTVTVQNVGSVLGDHTVLLFVTDAYRSITPPNKELKGYDKLTLLPNEQRTVEFQFNRTDFSFISLNNTRLTEPGLFIVTIGNLQANFTLLADGSDPSLA